MGAIVTLSGEYDLSSERQLRRILEPLRREPEVVLDFSDVSYLDSTCIAQIVLLHRARLEQGFSTETIIVRRDSYAVRRVFEVTGLTRTCTVLETA